MPAFNDAICPKCRTRIGWAGELRDCPPCPKCRFQIPPDTWKADEEEMEKFRKMLQERDDKRKGKEG